MNKYGVLVIAMVAGMAVAVSADAQGFHGHHHGSSAVGMCLAAAPSSVKQNLWSTFSTSPIHQDHAALETAKTALTQAILTKNTSLSGLETAVSQAQLKLLQDEDAIASSVCGQLTTAQLQAANTLYTNLQSNRQTVHGYFQAAHQAAGE